LNSHPGFEMLIERHGAEIFAYLWRMVGNSADAEDCLQDTFLRAFRAYPRLDARGEHRAWLYKIATNVARTYLRRRKRLAMHTVDLDPECLQGSLSPGEEVDRRQRLAAVTTAVGELPYKQRAALILRKYQGLSYAAIASTLGGTESSARANVYQALKKLRARFVTDTERSRETP
jgi:RNA polymerase sigma-70 factor (ECF subfamily)